MEDGMKIRGVAIEDWNGLSPDILKDGWDAEETRTFVKRLRKCSKTGELRHHPHVVDMSLKFVRSGLNAYHGSTRSMAELRQKLKQLRFINQAFEKFLEILAVVYNSKRREVYTTSAYWDYVDETEPLMFKRFRESTCRLEQKIRFMFQMEGVAELPDDSGSSEYTPLLIGDGEEGNNQIGIQNNFPNSSQPRKVSRELLKRETRAISMNKQSSIPQPCEVRKRVADDEGCSAKKPCVC